MIICRSPCARVLTAGLAAAAIACAAPRKSQPALVQQHLGSTVVTIRYNRPSARGRALFGTLVPYGQPWDPGADEATTLDVNHDVTFGGQPLARGWYSIWVVPQPTGPWTFILSRASNVYHIPYPVGHDALRIAVNPAVGPYIETLAYDFPTADSSRAIMQLRWGTTVLEIPIVVQ